MAMSNEGDQHERPHEDDQAIATTPDDARPGDECAGDREHGTDADQDQAAASIRQIGTGKQRIEQYDPENEP